jgi:predicted branched-subunit amino acid permease
MIDRQAISDALPLLVSAVPFAFVLGLAMIESEMPAAVAWSSSLFVYAGAAQLAVVTLAGTASVWAVIAAAFVINARLFMYGAALASTFQDQPRWFRWAGPMLLIDQVFAFSSANSQRSPAEFRRYYLSIGLFFYLNWQWLTLLGMAVGPVVPDSWRLDYAPPVMFVGLVLIGINRAPQAAAATVGGLVSLVTAGLQDRLGILIGATAGVLAGAITELRFRSVDGRSD